MIISKEKAIRLREIIEMAMNSAVLEDVVAIEATTLFPEWKAETAYKVGDKVKYYDVLYRVLTDHSSQEAWTPDASPSLFAKVLIPEENKIYDWEQPNSTNPYSIGAKVYHNGKTWESLVDNNVWEPGAVGTETLWVEVME